MTEEPKGTFILGDPNPMIDKELDLLERRIEKLNRSATDCDLKDVSALSYNIGHSIGQLTALGQHRTKEWVPLADRFASILKEINGLCVPKTGTPEFTE